MKRKILFTFILAILFLGFNNQVLADTNINLSIQADSGSIFNETISVTPCDSDNNPDTPDTITPYCAILQSGLDNDWSWWGDDAFLNSIDGIENNDGGNGIYWGYFSNLELGEVALNKYILRGGDNILLTYGINPIKISVNNENPKVGNTIEIRASFFEYDSSWNPIWSPLTEGTINIGDDSFDLESNIFEYKVDNLGFFDIQVLNDSYVSSNILRINPESTTRYSSGGGGSHLVYKRDKTSYVFNLQKAINFLKERQKEDGSWGDDLYTDWVTIALGKAEGVDNSLLKEFILTDSLEDTSITDYERRAMALMALDINPYSGTKINYIQKILDNYNDEQFGNSDFYNDDLFALLILSNAGYSYEDEIIKNTISLLLSKQKPDGSFGDVDMTAVFVEALSNFKDIEEVNLAIDKAENYLLSKQKSDGSFGNNFSSAWVLQVVDNSSVKEKGKEYFAKEQKMDGGILGEDKNENNRIWATAYVIPSFLNLSWNDILTDFNKEKILKNVTLELNLKFEKNGKVKLEKKVEKKEKEKKNKEISNKEIDPNLNFGKEYQPTEKTKSENSNTKFYLLGILVLGIIIFFVILK